MNDNAHTTPGFEWKWLDPSHLEAHRNDFIQDPESILAQVYTHVRAEQPNERQMRRALDEGTDIWFHRDFELADSAGFTGLRNVCEESSHSFWAYRRGRGIPSHLCLGEKRVTRWVCLWGRWAPNTFLIHTLYPGRAAPREIHDPSLELDGIAASVDFWRCHAIVVGENEYSVHGEGEPAHD